MIEPLRFAFEVEWPLQGRLRSLTRRTSSWWPVSHTVSAEPGLQVIFEGRPGGRIFERTPGGREVEWGEITVWEPPHRLGYLWYIRKDRADATDVEIRFKGDGQAPTRVEIEHRAWERVGSGGSAWRDANQGGWNGVLPEYVSICARVATTHRATT
jgi:hypothetical protein